MFKKIKSIYFIKTIFLALKEVKKLKIVKYNKSLQNTLELKLINYKYFKGRYIKYEKMEKGKNIMQLIVN